MTLTNWPAIRAKATGAVTDSELLPAPGVGFKYRVRQVYITADFLVEVFFESGTSDEKWNQFCPANGGSVVPASGSAWFETNENEALTYSHAGAGTVTVSVNYEKVRV